MQAQSTRLSQKLFKHNQILSVLALCTVTASLFITIPATAQVSEVLSSNISLSPVSRISSITTVASAISSSQNLVQPPVSQPISRASNQVVPVATTTFVGELDRKEGNSIFVSKDNQVKQYAVTNDIKVSEAPVFPNSFTPKEHFDIGETLGDPSVQRVALQVPVSALLSDVNQLSKKGISLEHVYDY